jgi:hypothetical protein
MIIFMMSASSIVGTREREKERERVVREIECV